MVLGGSFGQSRPYQKERNIKMIKKKIDSVSGISLIEEILTDGSKVYNVTFIADETKKVIEIGMPSLTDAEHLFLKLLKMTHCTITK